MKIFIVFVTLLVCTSASLLQDFQKSLAKKVLKEVVDENRDEMNDFIQQVFENEIKKNEESKEEQTVEPLDEKDKEKVFQQSAVDEKLSDNADGVHILEAIKDFDEKIKAMEPKDVTNAETVVEKQEEALAEQKAEDKIKLVPVVEGDIIKTEEVDAVMKNDTAKRNLHTSEKWGLLVAYQLPQIIRGDGRMQRAINEAMKEISSISCIKFIKRKNDGTSRYNVDFNGKTEPYLQFFQGYGCYSYVGKQGGGQVISIGNNCEYKGTVMHEILHALGFYHEQSRLDRDDFVQIRFENIRSGLENNFQKYDVGQADTLGFSYDLGSIMHYGSNFFTKNGQSTIEVLGDKKPIGQRVALSETDKLKLNKLYCSPQYQQEYNNLRTKNFAKMYKNVYARY